jgi:hypothetical protein
MGEQDKDRSFEESELRDIEKGITTTKGVASTVYNLGEEIGHVLLIDYDDKSLSFIEEMVSDMPGYNVILRSSERSYHYWNLTVRSDTKTLWEQVRLHDDLGHLARGVRQDKWILRTSPKVRPSQRQYKPAPKLEKCFVNPTEEPQSVHHWEFAKGVWGIPDLEPPWVNWGGDAVLKEEKQDTESVAVTIEEYLTPTDELKSEVWG